MSGRFADRGVVITGGSAGIGRVIADHFAREGARVLIIGRTEETLAKAADEINADGGDAHWHQADMRDVDDVAGVLPAAQDKLGRVDVMVNNAGIFHEAPLLQATLESWQEVMAVNLTAPFLLTQQAATLMAEQGGGVVVNLASIDGHGVDGPYVSYNVSKAALLHLTRQAAVELGPLGIRVNSVSPGWTLTPMVESALSLAELEVMNGNHDRVPLRRMVTVDEVASAVSFLASDAATGITGTDLVVDAGTIANLYILETLTSSTTGTES